MDATTVGIWLGALGFIGTAAGVWITFASARHASRDSAEADRMLRMLLRALHNSELAEVRFDADGRPVGLTIYGSVTDTARASDESSAIRGMVASGSDEAQAGNHASAVRRNANGSPL